MKRFGRRTLVVVLTVSLAMPVPLASSAADGMADSCGNGGPTEAISVEPDGELGGRSAYAHVSGNGRFVVFRSTSRTLLEGERPKRDVAQIYLCDRGTGALTLVSRAYDGSIPRNPSYFTEVSSSGRFVAFQSVSNRIVRDDRNGMTDIFVLDRATMTYEIISRSPSGEQSDDLSSQPDLSGDGRFVAYASQATNLVADDTNGVADIFVTDRQSGVTSLVSRSSDGGLANRDSWNVTISADGRYIAYTSEATNLVDDDDNRRNDIFLTDLETGETTLVSRTEQAVPADGDSGLASISADGSQIAYYSHARDLVGRDRGPRDEDVFLYDVAGEGTVLVSHTTDGGYPGGGGEIHSGSPEITADGTAVFFVSSAQDLVTDPPGIRALYRYDVESGVNAVLPGPDAYGPVESYGGSPSASSDGRLVAYGGTVDLRRHAPPDIFAYRA